MISISEVEEILANHPWLKPPRNIIIVYEPIEMVEGYKKIFFAGITPSWKNDTIVLSSLATPETVIHEIIHTYGLGEFAAWILAPRILKFRELFPPLIKRRVHYTKCDYCEEFKVLHEKYSGRAEHYKLCTD